MNTKSTIILCLALLTLPLMAATSMAHSALCSCLDNGDGTITCEGGFSDGSSASGVRIFVRTMAEETIIRGKMNQDGEFSFAKPDTPYMVIFDAGPGHQVEILSKDIVE